MILAMAADPAHKNDALSTFRRTSAVKSSPPVAICNHHKHQVGVNCATVGLAELTN